MRNAHARLQRLGRRVDKLGKRVFIPIHKTLRRLFLLDFALFLRIAASFLQGLGVFDLVLRRFGYDHAFGIEPRAAGTTGYLMKLAGAQTAHLEAVEFRKSRQNDRMDGHVDTHTQRIGTADDRKQPLLRKLLHQKAITRQHARMMHAHAAPQKTLKRLAKRRGEARSLDGILDGIALFFRCNAVACQGLRGIERGVLRKMHDVKRRFGSAYSKLNRTLDRRFHVFVRKRHRARSISDDIDIRIRMGLEGFGNNGDVAKRRAHQQELRMRKRQQRNLPRPATLRVSVEVKLVHSHAADIGAFPLAQRLVRENLGRAAYDRSVRIDGHIARNHADVFPAQHIDKIEELLADKGLDRRGVI